MAMAKFNLKTMPGIDRPAIAARLADDARANRSCSISAPRIGADAQHLVDLAVMGSAMARVLFELERPTVGLLNIGVEEVKGLEEVREAGRILREAKLPFFDYTGFVEGDDIGKGTGRRGGDRRLRRQYRAQGGRGHRAPDRQVSQGAR